MYKLKLLVNHLAISSNRLTWELVLSMPEEHVQFPPGANVLDLQRNTSMRAYDFYKSD